MWEDKEGVTKRVKEQNQLVSVGLCLQRGLLHWPRLCCWEGRAGMQGCQLTFLKQFMGFQSSRGVSGVEQSQLPSRWRRKAGGTRKGRKRLGPGRVESSQPINCFSTESPGKQTRGCFSPAPDHPFPSFLPSSLLPLPRSPFLL